MNTNEEMKVQVVLVCADKYFCLAFGVESFWTCGMCTEYIIDRSVYSNYFPNITATSINNKYAVIEYFVIKDLNACFDLNNDDLFVSIHIL